MSDGNKADRYFVLSGDLQFLTDSPNCNMLDAMALFGHADFLMQQSIVPVVAWRDSEHLIRCIGTATIISCTGYVLTAAHVLMDPIESGYGATRVGREIRHSENLNFGVLIPHWRPLSGISLQRSYLFFPFEMMCCWGQWKESPLIHEEDRFEYLTDIAICKIPQFPNGIAHQPLQMSLNPFSPGEDAYALGYAEAPDMHLDPRNGGIADRKFRFDLHVSVGNIIGVFPQNHTLKQVSTPGPCFDFDARIPGKMSGAPVFGAGGAVIRGVVSRSFTGEEHAFGSMLGPAMDLPIGKSGTSKSLRSLLKNGNEGMAQVVGSGL